MKRRAALGALYALALAGALLPLPALTVERWYSRGLYPPLQRILTSATNLVPFALFDVLCIAATALAFAIAYRRIRTAGWRSGTRQLLAGAAHAGAIVYLAFLAMWGLNYRRVPLTGKLEFDPSRVTATAAVRFGDANAAILNARYAEAHQAPASRDVLAAAFQDAVRVLGAPGPVVPGRPKQTLFGEYFHQTAVAGMTDPFLLETLIAPDLLEVELPFVIAHEWAHLAGYADESEANFVAWLTCGRADGAAQYSGALSLIGYQLPKTTILDPGPRSDLFAIRYRYSRTSRTLRVAARNGYDRYLKANRVERGVESYDAVVQLILGTGFDPRGNPRLR
jgi:hypothetical protein